MPSPLNGLTAPAASPITTNVGPALGPTDPAIGRRPPVGACSGDSGSMSQNAGAVAAHSVMRCEVLTDFQPLNVDSRPMPTLMVPSPTGKIHPYPGSDRPWRSRTSSADSIHGSSCRGLS
jgi:hypothetical protein